MRRWKKEVCLLAVFGLTLLGVSAHATTCYTAGSYGRTAYCSIQCTCNDGTIQYSSSDCSALYNKCCRWRVLFGPGGSCTAVTYCSNCAPPLE